MIPTRYLGWLSTLPISLWVFLWNPWAAVFPLLLFGIGLRDVLQSKHAILRNYPLLGHFRFLLEYIDLMQHERVREPEGFRRVAPGAARHADEPQAPRNHGRWVVNKIRALGAYYTKGVGNGAELRAGLNTTGSVEELKDLVRRFFGL